jgi:hypothetical protein
MAQLTARSSQEWLISGVRHLVRQISASRATNRAYINSPFGASTPVVALLNREMPLPSEYRDRRLSIADINGPSDDGVPPGEPAPGEELSSPLRTVSLSNAQELPPAEAITSARQYAS